MERKELKMLCVFKHLNKSERDILHRPKSDYCNTKRGKVLKNSCSVKIDDIVDKHGVRIRGSSMPVSNNDAL